MVINSVSNDKIMLLKKLKLTKYREKEKLFIIEGEHLVNEALKNNLLKEVFILEGTDYNLDTTKNYVTESVMKVITSLDTISTIIGLCAINENNIIGDKNGKHCERSVKPNNNFRLRKSYSPEDPARRNRTCN